MAVDDIHSSRGQYTELIAMLQKQKTRLEPIVDPNSEFRRSLSQCLKDLPKDDENVQTIVQELDYFCEMYKKVENYIRILQRSDKGGAIAYGN